MQNQYKSRCSPEVSHRPSLIILGANCIQGIWQLATANLDDSWKSFNLVLQSRPTNIIALLGKARISYARKQYTPALRLFQQVLQLKPDAQPDPRVGIGMCYWAMEQKQRARLCWERSLEVVREATSSLA